MLISKRPRNVRYGRPSDENSEQQSHVSSSSRSGDKENQPRSRSSSQSKARPKPRPSQSGSTLDFESNPNQAKEPLFRNNDSDNDSDSEMQNGEAVAESDLAEDADTEEEGEIRPILSGSRKKRSNSEMQNGEAVVDFDPAEDADTEEEGEIRPILSGFRKKRSKVPKQAVPSSTESEQDESAEEDLEPSTQTQQAISASNVIEISSDEDEADDSVARENTVVAQRDKRTSRSRARSISKRASDEENLGDWNQEDEDGWLQYFRKSSFEGNFGVEKVIRCRRHPRKHFIQYRVKWKGFRDWSNTWEPGNNFNHRKCIDDFWKLRKKMYGLERPANTYKADDDRLSESDTKLDSDDTDEEVKKSDSERREQACKRKVNDIRRDRFTLREIKLYKHGKDITLARSEKRKRDAVSDEGDAELASSSKTASAVSSSTRSQEKGIGEASASREKQDTQTGSPMEAFVVDDGNDDDDGEYVDSLQDDYMPLPKSHSAPAIDDAEREASQPAQGSRSSTGEASLELACSSKPANAVSSSTRSQEKGIREGSASREKPDSQPKKDLMSYAATFAISVKAPVRRTAKNGKTVANESMNNHASGQQEVRVAPNDQGALVPSERHAYKGAHKAPGKTKMLEPPKDPLNRLSDIPDGHKRRRLTLSSAERRADKNLDKVVPLEQPEPTSAVDRLFANGPSGSNNCIDLQAESNHVTIDDAPLLDWDTDTNVQKAEKSKSSVRFDDNGDTSGWNDNIEPNVDTEMTEKQDQSCGWDAVEDIQAESSNDCRASQMPRNNANHYAQPRNERENRYEHSNGRRFGTEFNSKFNSKFNATSSHSGWDGNRGDQQMNTGNGYDGWDDGNSTVRRSDDRNVPDIQGRSYKGANHPAMPHNLPSRSMHPDRLSQLHSSDATLNEAFQDVQIASPSSPIAHTSWRKNVPLPTQKESLGAARKNERIPKSDSGMVAAAENRHEGMYVNTPSSYTASEAGDSEICERRIAEKKLNLKYIRNAQSWYWTEELKEIIRSHYHLLPMLRQGANGKKDEVGETLHNYIIYKGGGFRPSLDDRLREVDRKCVMWIRDIWGPLGDQERECLALRHFKFISIDFEAENKPTIKLIWPSEKPRLTMYSLGALVCKTIEWCQARRIEDENKRTKALRAFHSDEKTLCHAWQRLAISTLLEAKRMGEFLEQVLGLDKTLAIELEFMMVDDGISVLENMEECRGRWTYEARVYPTERPDGPEALTDDLTQFTFRLDREVHCTLMTMQHWCSHSFRTFNFAIAGCSMEASQIGTCYSRVDIPSSSDHPDAE
ncbi:uncharacterized protein FA14DRAFT_153122 [Meira miltonrushii]|uniref:Chromo domain-containing protein n=1 Tax=Meira miltonrushii TaxID=1280837 RepID=A0A316VKJ3_9BASI|nr:uncharacterized protein FA14DRAFT_153122 [Meira miltonrushii]PWN37764.1 hypothetical protein FA14DRAFT_153122 [Meira miltonrushii]